MVTGSDNRIISPGRSLRGNRGSKRRGLSLMEMIGAMLIMFMTLGVTLILQSFAIISWSRADRNISASTQANIGVAAAAAKLTEAMKVDVNSNGMRVDFTVPARNADGSIMVPMIADATVRSIYYENGKLLYVNGTETRTLAKNVLGKYPVTLADYRIFTQGTEAIVREITIRLYTSNDGKNLSTSTFGYSTTTVRIRNVPNQ